MAALDWAKSPAFLANVGHVMAGALVVLVTLLFTHSRDAIVTMEFLFVAYVAIKEFVLDLTMESGEDFASSTIDALGYLAGHVAGWGLVLLAHHLGSSC